MAPPQSLPQLLELLHRAFKAQQHYTQDHPKVQQSMGEVLAHLQRLLAIRSPQILTLRNGRFMHEGKPVLGAPNAAQALEEEFHLRHIGGLVFHQGLTLDELQLLFFALQLTPQRLEEMGGADGLLQDTNVTILPMEEPSPEPPAPLDRTLPGHPVAAKTPQRPPLAAAGPPVRPQAPAQAPALSKPAAPPSGTARAKAPEMPGPADILPPRPAAPPSEPVLDLTPSSKVFLLPGKVSLDDLLSGLSEAAVPPSPASLAVELRSLFEGLLARTSQEPKRSARTPWGLEQRESLKRAAFKVPDFADLDGTGARLTLGRMDPITLREAMRTALSAMDPIDQGSILLGLHTFPEQEQALKRALDYLAPELLAQAIAAVHVNQKPSIFELALIAAAFLQSVKDFELSLESIRGRLQYEGWGIQEVDQLREAIVWESHGTDTKMRLGFTGKNLFDLDPHQVMIMNRQLIRRGREEDLRKLLAQLNEGFSSPIVDRRRQAMAIFADLAECLEEPGLPGEIENRMATVFREFIKAETDQQALLWCLQAHEALLGHWVRKGQFDLVYQEILTLGELILPRTLLPGPKIQAIQDMLARLGGPLNLAILVPMLHDSDKELSTQRLHALLALLGRPAANYIVVCLELEEDRTRQQQLLAALLALGRHAVPSLHDALASPHWVLVRQAAMLLGELGSKTSVPKLVLALEHRDLRVRKAVIATLAKLGGPEATAALVRLLETKDPSILMECLLALGELKDASAVAPIAQFLASTSGSGEEALKLRLRAVEALAHIASPETVEPLLSLFRKKGFLGTRESTPIRLAASRALAAIGTREAREAMAVALEGEPHEDVRGVLRQFLVSQ